MKKGIILLAVVLLLSCYVGALPRGNPCYSRIFMPTNWKVKENVMCPHGYVCYHDMWVPSITVNYPMWVFGVSNQERCGGIIHFRKSPDEPCVKNCVQDIPVLYKAEVIYVSPYEQPTYTPEEVPLTYIPPGEYVVTSPDFVMYHNIRIWHFTDEGGPKRMHVDFKSDKPKYGRNDATAVLTVQVTDESGEYIEVDSISGVIILPDCTQKTVNPEDWSWNNNDKSYEYSWNFTNDDGVCADPKEGIYTAEVYVKKKYYEDVQAATSFGVCYHVAIDLTFDKDIPEYSLGELVKITVHAADENGAPLSADVKSVLLLPDGTVFTDLEWTQTDPGTYVTSYLPQQEGAHHITVEVTEDIKCYLEEASGTFHVRTCDDALVMLTIGDAVLDEPVELVLTVTDGNGNPLPGGDVTSFLYLPGGSRIPLSWTDQKDGTYKTVYTPSAFGLHTVCGYVIVPHGTGCSKGFFDGYFDVSDIKKLPDLVIRNQDITITPEPQLKETVTISVTVWNNGTADAEEFWAVVLINDIVVYREFIQVLAAGDSITIEFEWTFWYTRGYVIEAIVDPWEELV